MIFDVERAQSIILYYSGLTPSLILFTSVGKDVFVLLSISHLLAERYYCIYVAYIDDYTKILILCNLMIAFCFWPNK